MVCVRACVRVYDITRWTGMTYYYYSIVPTTTTAAGGYRPARLVRMWCNLHATEGTDNDIIIMRAAAFADIRTVLGICDVH